MTASRTEMERKIQDVSNESPQKAPADPTQNVSAFFGRYQFYLFTILIATKFPMAFHQMAIVFLAPKVSFICEDSGNQTCPCAHPIYDTSVFTRTVIMEWDLICERKYLASFMQTLFQFGILIGSIIFGIASDRFGRKKSFITAGILLLTAGVVAAYVKDYWTFSLLRVVIGASLGGIVCTGFVILMEFVGKDSRDTVSIVFNSFYNVALTVLPVFGYFFRDYSDFQLAISIPALFFILYVFLLPESPRWLIAVNRTEEAVKILERVALINNISKEKIRSDVAAYRASIVDATEEKQGSTFDLIRTPNLRRHILAMSFHWACVSYYYYGSMQYVGQLSGNIFINVAASNALSMLLGGSGALLLVKISGRKRLSVALSVTCAACLLAVPVVPDGPVTVALTAFGTVCSFINFCIAYLYCTELFPTVVRSGAFGICSMMARTGSMLAPFVIDLQVHGGWAPPVGFAVLPLCAALVVALWLPETKGCELMTTIEEGEAFGRKS